MISVTCTTGKSIINSIAGYPSTIATISSVGELSGISAVYYVIITTLILLTLWAGFGLVYVLNHCSGIVQKERRRKFVIQIKKRRFKKKHMKDVEEQPTCSICLCEFEENDVIRKLRCGHFFHIGCIDPWLVNERAVCPVCRQGIYELEEWNALEEGQRRDIDVALGEVEQHTACNFSNLFSLVLCIFVVGCPFILSVL